MREVPKTKVHKQETNNSIENTKGILRLSKISQCARNLESVTESFMIEVAQICSSYFL